MTSHRLRNHWCWATDVMSCLEALLSDPQLRWKERHDSAFNGHPHEVRWLYLITRLAVLSKHPCYNRSFLGLVIRTNPEPLSIKLGHIIIQHYFCYWHDSTSDCTIIIPCPISNQMYFHLYIIFDCQIIKLLKQNHWRGDPNCIYGPQHQRLRGWFFYFGPLFSSQLKHLSRYLAMP